MTAPVSAPAPLSTWRAVRHLCRYDLARYRVLIAAMVGLELLRMAYVERTLQIAPIAIDPRFGSAAGEAEVYMLDLSIWAMTWVATAVVVQGDHPSDDRAFWRTRPLAPHAVALAKVALLLLVSVGVPALINSVRLAAYGAPLSAHVAATIQIAVTAGGAIVPAWALAIVTRTLPAFLAGAGGLVVFTYLSITGMLFSIGSPGWASFGTGVSLVDWSRSSALGWALALVLTAVALAVLVAHYFLRRAWVTVTAGIALLFATGFLPTPHQAAPPPPEIAALVAAPLRPPAGLWSYAGGSGPGGTALAFVEGRLALPALPGLRPLRSSRGAAGCPGERRGLVGGARQRAGLGDPGDARETRDARRRRHHRLHAAPARGVTPADARRGLRGRRLPRRGALDDRTRAGGGCSAPHQPFSSAVAQHVPDALVLPRRPGAPARRQVAPSVLPVDPAGRRPGQGVGPGASLGGPLSPAAARRRAVAGSAAPDRRVAPRR
jgi:hypothetical protein